MGSHFVSLKVFLKYKTMGSAILQAGKKSNKYKECPHEMESF
jgi:hypothetical protein